MAKMLNSRCQSWLCCTTDLTIATRLIAIIGMTTFGWIMTVLLVDFAVKDTNVNRKIAFVLGLDWSRQDRGISSQDVEEKAITIVLIVYVFLSFLTNASLFFATIVKNSVFAIPWLVCEFLAVLCKLSNTVFQIIIDKHYSNHPSFHVISVIYLVIVSWWLLVVYTTQSTWQTNPPSSLHLSILTPETTQLNSFLDSPDPYHPNSLYSII